MSPDILFFIAGLFIGGIVVYFYFNKEANARGKNGLTIEEMIVHEIKTPLTGLSWILNSLSEIKLGDTVNDEVITLVKEGKKKINDAMELASDALVAVNTNTDRTSYEFKKNDLAEVVRDVIKESSLGAKEKSIQVSFEVAKDVAPFFFDKIKITLAIRNIINNAIKYTPYGGKVLVEVHRDGNKMVTTVSDTGIGIPEVDRVKIFSKFFRAKNIGDTSGSGLGLFIVKNIITGHGGNIEIQSTEGKGTKVTVSLPIR